MAAFEYIVLDDKGREKKGIIEGDTPRQVRQVLRDKGMMPLQIETAANVEKKQQDKPVQISRRSISATDLALFTRQLATLVRAAIPLDEALSAVGQQTEKPRIQSMVFALRSKILEGHTLAAGLADFPKIFPQLFRATVAAGESSGHLDIVLDRLADYTESRQQMASKVAQATIYPAILTVMAFLVVTGLLMFVVPQIVEVFETSGQELPGITKMMIWISEFLQNWWGLLLLLAVAAFFGIQKFLSIPYNKRRFHLLLLKTPVLGKLVRGLNTARFSRTLSILSSSGVPVLDALQLAAPVVANLPMQDAILTAAEKVREGSSIYAALDRSKLFPPMTLHLISSGEKSGNLEDMLDKAAQQQERELELLIATFMGLFEPLLIVAMGGIVLIIVLSILLPIINMNDLMQ
ncbi:MAG: type II secretion system protein GspF [endosymbiont of Galathealinum brachiosum]|uniref:Type II secretion system protein GspF n=1 Tax=endosymbiont of Galathealinum brachiosum TaxID=2200906 RepID=A0A370DDE2_9GAMM|nr:MAG: type II secretion system protein GspF [endosymbiont of Galathealinum brachiosum]